MFVTRANGVGRMDEALERETQGVGVCALLVLLTNIKESV